MVLASSGAMVVGRSIQPRVLPRTPWFLGFLASLVPGSYGNRGMIPHLVGEFFDAIDDLIPR